VIDRHDQPGEHRPRPLPADTQPLPPGGHLHRAQDREHDRHRRPTPQGQSQSHYRRRRHAADRCKSVCCLPGRCPWLAVKPRAFPRAKPSRTAQASNQWLPAAGLRLGRGRLPNYQPQVLELRMGKADPSAPSRIAMVPVAFCVANLATWRLAHFLHTEDGPWHTTARLPRR